MCIWFVCYAGFDSPSSTKVFSSDIISLPSLGVLLYLTGSATVCMRDIKAWVHSATVSKLLWD